MDIHDRYMNLMVINKSILEVIEHFSNCGLWWPQIDKSIRACLLQITEDNITLEKLETLRTLLCYMYQNNANVQSVNIPLNDLSVCASKGDVICMINAVFKKNMLHDRARTTLLLDILVLYLTLYATIDYVIERFKDCLIICTTGSSFKEVESNHVALKAIEGFLDIFRLRTFLHTDNIKNHKEQIKELCSNILHYIESWLLNDDVEWGLLVSLLPKLVKVFDFESIISPLWKMVLNEDHHVKHRITIMCIMINVSFPLDPGNDTNVDYELCIQDVFWLLLLEQLSSPILQHRKQAMYVIKRVIEFIDVHPAQFNESRFGNCFIVPFICRREGLSNPRMQQMKKNFFLILEALEEKQKHLVMPALMLIETLIDGYREHKQCGMCFSFLWVHCIMQRVLQHENSAVVKWGVLHTFHLSKSVYNDAFLTLFVNTLNNTFLYECCGIEDVPEVTKELATLFIKAEKEKVGLSSRFIYIVSEISWGPVAIFHVMHALQMVPSDIPVYSIWQEDHLEAAKSLAEKNVNMHNKILRIGSQIGLIGALTYFVSEPCNLVIIANTLSAFPTDEALTYNSMCWNMVTSWLNRIIKVTDAVHFITDTCAQLLDDKAKLNISIRSFSLMIAFLYKAGLVFTPNNLCPAKKAIDNLLHSLLKVDVRFYSNTVVVTRSIELMGYLLEFSMTDNHKTIDCMISPYIDMALTFIYKCLRRSSTLTCYEDVDKYISIVYTIYKKITLQPNKNVSSRLEAIEVEAMHMLQETELSNSLQQLFALKILYLCKWVTHKDARRITFVLRAFTNQMQLKNSNKEDEEAMSLKGKTASEYYKITAQLIQQYLTLVLPYEWSCDIDWFFFISHIFNAGGNDVIPSIAACLKEIFKKHPVCISDHLTETISLINSAWKVILESRRNELYWLAVNELTKLILSHTFLKISKADDTVTEYVNYILHKGNEVPRLKVVLLQEMNELPTDEWNRFRKTLLTCLLHGEIPRRDQRIKMQACAFIMKNYEEHYADQMFSVKHYNLDAMVRAHSVILLLKFIARDSNYISLFLSSVINKLKQYKNKRYFNDSRIHRIKHRIMQVLLILQPMLTKEDTLTLYNAIKDLLLTESDQYSVRFMQEWLLIRIFLINSEIREKIWHLYNEIMSERPNYLSSIIKVMYHVCQLLSYDEQQFFVKRVIFYIIPTCMAQHFNVRLHAQVVLVKLYGMLSDLKLELVMQQCQTVHDAVLNNLELGSSSKNAFKLQEDFFFKAFHPTRDYSLETIYYELPRLLNLCTDEWISTSVFESLKFKDQDPHPIKVVNLDDSMRSSSVSSQVVKSFDEKLETDDWKQDFDNIQRKITPWKLSIPVDEELSEMSNLSISRQVPKVEEGIIVVASLVDSRSNVGGLARTCEIFGAKELVIENIKAMDSNEFRNLSVSAEKWITITEVKSDDLQTYLLKKRELGWTLVGAEQTANSISLTEIKFDKKTVLLLGNEKNGIPPHLLVLMNVCVEIPQVGIVRSLNVHVTGAICLWQYLNQHYFCT